jgi:hypothetical protein
MRRIRFTLLALAVALLALGIGAPLASAAPGPDDTTVNGYVYGWGGVGQSYWQMPLPNTGVYFVDPVLGPQHVATTNAYGAYSFFMNLKTQPGHEGEFFTSPVHYFRTNIEIHSHPGQTVNEVFRVEVLPTILTGKVTNKATGKPIKNAKVQILNWDVKTNAQGVYTFTSGSDPLTLKPNFDYKVWSNKSGFKRTSKMVKSLPTATGQVRTLNFQMVPAK